MLNWLSVSILVLMEVFRPGRHDPSALGVAVEVSILVLMEVFRPASRSSSTARPGRCFNPCSDGSVSTGGIASLPDGQWAGSLVSILVLMEVFRPAGAFQSLMEVVRRAPCLMNSFNPCSDGSVSTGRHKSV